MPGFLPTDQSYFFSHPPSCEKADGFFGTFYLPHPISKHREANSASDSGPIPARHFENPRNGYHDGSCRCADRKTKRGPTQVSKNGRKRIEQRLPPLGQKRETNPEKNHGTRCPCETSPWNKIFQRFAPKGVPQKAFLTLSMI